MSMNEAGGANLELWVAIGIATVANIVSLGTVAWQIRTSFGLLRAERRMNEHERRLTEFYGPLHSLLKSNAEIFGRAGPPAFPKEEGAGRTAAAASWALAKSKVLKNNEAIETLILHQAHNLTRDDEIGRYMELLVHVQMYAVFQDKETDWYLTNFRFPIDISSHVSAIYERELSNYQEAIGALEKNVRK